MPKLNITPQTVLLTSGQAATFEATDAVGKPVPVNWSLNPPIGSFTPGATAPSAIYIAPPIVASSQTIAVVASAGNNSASASISLTTDAIAIVPPNVNLSAGQSQKLIAIVAGPPEHEETSSDSVPKEGLTKEVTWILSPPLGTLNQEGLYTAPSEIRDSTTVTATVTSKRNGKQAVATINLASPPWTGPGVALLGAFILMVFMFVFFMVSLWPPALPNPQTAKADRIEAEKVLEEKTVAQEKAESDLNKAYAQLSRVKPASNKPGALTAAQTNRSSESDVAVAEAQAEYDSKFYIHQRAEEATQHAAKDLAKKQEIEEKVNDPAIDTRLAGHINRELDLLWLVLLAGSLGSFLHMAQSYSDYIGNRAIRSNWAWWYYMRPFIGAVLALVFYAAVRGGFMAIATGSNSTASELNPFGLVAFAALVGMFSRAATGKLGDVFDTLFKSDKAKESKDKLVPSNRNSNQPSDITTTDDAEAKK